jgi:hypothetical protein
MSVRCIEIVNVRVKDLPEAEIAAAHARSTADIRAAHPGLVGSHLVKLEDGTFTDVLLWSSRHEAQAALDGAQAIPGFVAWGELAEVLSFQMTDVVESTD